MRTPRSHIINSYSFFHKTWRAHNREFILSNKNIKCSYLQAIFHEKTASQRAPQYDFKIFAFCIMDNHVHEVGQCGGEIETLSNWMRQAHSWFGQNYNKIHKRTGKVAQDRPHTSRLQRERDLIQASFYTEANPMRAGKVKHAREYKWSSYRFYAFGEKNEYTKHLDYPDWYNDLGKTPDTRQRNYRKLFDEYCRRLSLIPQGYSHKLFIGDPLWIANLKKNLRTQINLKTHPPPMIL